MTVALQSEKVGNVLEVRLSGRLTGEDYERFVPELERLIREQGKLRLLVRMHDFHGWSLGALWEDLKFDIKHFADIERLALVGERKWESGMATFCKPFTKAEIRYFDEAQEAEAVNWIHEGEPIA